MQTTTSATSSAFSPAWEPTPPVRPALSRRKSCLLADSPGSLSVSDARPGTVSSPRFTCSAVYAAWNGTSCGHNRGSALQQVQ